MDFSHSEKVRLLQERLERFMEAHVYPAERRFDEEMEKNRREGNPWRPSDVVEDLKRKARAVRKPAFSDPPQRAQSRQVKKTTPATARAEGRRRAHSFMPKSERQKLCSQGISGGLSQKGWPWK